jgi:hypothetical protein
MAIVRPYKDELKKKKRKKLILGSALILLFIFIFLIAAVYALFFAKLLDVRTIKITVPEGVSQTDLNAAINKWLDAGFWKLTRRNDILFFSGTRLSDQLAKQFPELDSIVVNKHLPHSLELSVSKRKPAGIWCLSVAAGGCFYFDKNGVAYAEATPTVGFLILNVNDSRNNLIKLGDKVASHVWVDNIILAKELLVKIGLDTSEFDIPVDSFDEFDAKTAYGWPVIFSDQTDITRQINSLAQFLKEKLTPTQTKTLEYVDLRIQDRIYYK